MTSGALKEGVDSQSQSVGNPFNVHQRDIAFAALNRTHIGAMEAGSLSKLLLRPSFPNTQLTDSASKPTLDRITHKKKDD